MKVNELIKKLNTIKELHGNCEVHIGNSPLDVYPAAGLYLDDETTYLVIH